MKTLLTLMLLAATSCALFYGAAEYAAAASEYERAVSHYKGVGAVSRSAPLQKDDDFWERYRFRKLLWPIEDFKVYGLDHFLYADERVKVNPYGEQVKRFVPEPLGKEALEEIVRLPYVTAVETRYMTAGVSATLQRADLRTDYYNFTDRIIFEATLDDVMLQAEIRSVDDHNASIHSLAEDGYWLPPTKEGYNALKLYFSDVDLLAGNRDWFYFGETGKEAMRDDWQLYVTAIELNPEKEEGIFPLFSYPVSQRVHSIMRYSGCLSGEMSDHEFITGLTPGERYIVIARCESGLGPYDRMIFLTDPSTLGWFPQITPLKGYQDDYLALEEFTPLREMIEITQSDLHTLDVVYTGDMSAIMRFADGDMVISDGRMLAKEDDACNVCVMNGSYMRLYGLEVGDSISLKLGNRLFEQNPVIGAVASVKERYADAFTEEIEFEIVGAYWDVDTKEQRAQTLFWTYSESTVFVPASFLTATVTDDQAVRPGEFNFVIGDPRDIPAFLDECKEIITGELGLEIYFSDGGWHAVETRIKQANVVALLKLLLFTVSIIIAIGLTAYLFISRKKKEYAVMRALGAPARMSSRSLFVPLSLLVILGIASGNALAVNLFSMKTFELTVQYLEMGSVLDAAIPAYVTGVCVLLEIAVLVSAAALIYQRLGKRPLLELLQSDAHDAMRERRRTRNERGATPEAASISPVVITQRSGSGALTWVDTGGNPSLRKQPHAGGLPRFSASRLPKQTHVIKHTFRYIARHVRRSKLRSTLAAALAFALAGAIGQFTASRLIYADIYSSLEVNAYVFNGIEVSGAYDISNSGLIAAEYYENTIELFVDISGSASYIDTGPMSNLKKKSIVMTNDLTSCKGGSTDVEFLDDYDLSLFNYVSRSALPRSNICVLNSALMDELGIELGGSVQFVNKHIESLEDILDLGSVEFKVVGRTDSAGNVAAFVPISKGLARILDSEELYFERAEFTILSPEYAEEFREFVEKRVAATIGSDASPLIMDTSEADNVQRTIRLLSALYPIAVAVSLAMGALLQGLIVAQSDKEASIMRVLGTTKRRTHAVLITEQALLCLVGLICAELALIALNGVLPSGSAMPLVLCAVLQLAAGVAGSAVCAVLVTIRRPLELLQVKG